MKISGKIFLFVEDKTGRENSQFKTFSTSISTPKEDGSFINKSLEVRFNEKNITRDKLNMLSASKVYTLEVEDAWLSVREYTKDEVTKRVIYLFIDKATIKDSKAKKNSNELPF